MRQSLTFVLMKTIRDLAELLALRNKDSPVVNSGRGRFFLLVGANVVGTINSTSDYSLWTFYRSCFKGINANIELQVYSETCC
jgi:hypothetical protein